MSSQQGEGEGLGIPPTPPDPPAPTPTRAARPAKKAAASSGDPTIQTTVDQSFKDLFTERAKIEERTEAVLARRALKKFMDGWDSEEARRKAEKGED